MKISYPLVLGRLIGLIRSKLLKGPQRREGEGNMDSYKLSKS